MSSTLARLLDLEAAEQATWITSVPAWHPRAETNGAGGDPAGGDGDSGDGDSGDQGGDPDDSGETVTMTRAEVRALEQQRDEARRAAASASRRQREREREAARSAGNYEELYNEANGRVERATGLIRTNAVNRGVEAAAERLGFRTPSLASRLIDTRDLSLDVDLDAETLPELDAAASTLVERRLREVLEREPGLLRDGPGRMLPGAGQSTNAGGGGDSGNAAMNAAIRAGAGRSR